ncbi:Lipocalin-like domain-containing protein [Mucilaginibacter mallensis]|uniref:Lipocalin-like domain-containing protein n=1 Tax=Mucilaginibacter mallensis TaxID=652787 RepID=A0A1H2C5P7_MUCMA|nr:lipocalin family protein [Mucilaginibacter mallensis]SDT65577.1 Lipocalin-like domain-containing protein [Mucilaginibacter mallensis]
MKKISFAIIALLAVTFLFTSCAAKKSTVNNNIVSRGKFVGTWTLTAVTYDGLLPAAVQVVFNQGPAQSFVNSTWKLTNSGNGSYTLGDGTSQTIFWSVLNGDGMDTMFQFKKLFEGDKAQKVDDGYRLVIGSNDGSSMVLKTPVAVGDKTGYIVYSFSKK